jgi:hypothetical protein
MEYILMVHLGMELRSVVVMVVQVRHHLVHPEDLVQIQIVAVAVVLEAVLLELTAMVVQEVQDLLF